MVSNETRGDMPFRPIVQYLQHLLLPMAKLYIEIFITRMQITNRQKFVALSSLVEGLK